jgi:hypothetical protein
MVLPASRGVPRVPRYSGHGKGRLVDFAYGAVTLSGTPFQKIRLSTRFVTSRRVRRTPQSHIPRHRPGNARRAWHPAGLGCFRFARRYFGNHSCFPFLGLLRCFSSPRRPPRPIYSVADVATLPATGFPIRKSPDQRSFSSSPRLIAAFYVLPRLSTPRHPPSALINLATNYFSLNAFMCLLLVFACQRSSLETSLVEVNGFEPMASCVQGRRSPS